MGSGQSARRLTISNEEEVGVIKISNAIVQRLAQRETKINESTNMKPISSTSIIVPQTDVYPMYYYPELTMSALQIQQQKEKELTQQKQYWEKRLENLKESYQKIERTLKDEYKKAINETSITQVGQEVTDTQDTMQLCLQNSNKVLKCFQDHPKETLRCSDLVEEFSNCVWNMHNTYVIKTHS